MLQLIISSLLASLMLCLFLFCIGIPVFIIGAIYLTYKNWKQKFFPRGTRIYIKPEKEKFSRSTPEKQNEIIDVEFHEVK